LDIRNINDTSPLWAESAFKKLDIYLSSFDHPLSERIAKLHNRFGRGNGANSVSGAMSAESATPIIAVLEALRLDYAISPNDPRLEQIGFATLLLYFYVRLQDDIVDEPDQFDSSYVYILQVLYDTCQRCFAEALDGSIGFLQFQEKTMCRFASVSLLEFDSADSHSPTNLEADRIGGKFLPMAIPIGAVTLLAQPATGLDNLIDFVIKLGTGLQFVNDILNIQEDHKAKRLTPILRWLYDSNKVAPGDDPKDIRLLLINDATLQRALERAQSALQAAEDIAFTNGLVNLATIARNRNEYVKTIPYRLFALQLGVSKL